MGILFARAGGRADGMGQMRSLQEEAKRVREELQASTTVRLAGRAARRGAESTRAGGEGI